MVRSQSSSDLSDDGRPDTLDPGVVEGDVQAAKFLHRFLDQRFNFSCLRHVGFHKQAIAAGGADHFDGFVAFRFSPARNYHVSSRLREKHGGITANTRGPARHDSNLAFQFLCHRFPKRIRHLKMERKLIYSNISGVYVRSRGII